MSEIYFTSDLHFGHKNVIMFDNRPFSSIEEMDAELIRRWNERVTSKDTVYILGDFSWYNTEKTVEILNQLNGKKFLIRGNHDRINIAIQNCFEKVTSYHEINISGQHIVLCHYPIHFFNRHHYGSIMLYGHVHNGHEENMVQAFKSQMQQLGLPCRMFNVGCMHWNYTPVTLKEILATEKTEEVDIHE